MRGNSEDLKMKSEEKKNRISSVLILVESGVEHSQLMVCLY